MLNKGKMTITEEVMRKERDELVKALWPEDQRYQNYTKTINFVGRIYAKDCSEEPLGCAYSDECTPNHCVVTELDKIQKEFIALQEDEDTEYASYLNFAYDEDEDEDEELDNELYFILEAQSNSIKIGVSKDVEKRLSQLQTSNAFPLLLIGRMQNRIDLEKNLHEKFKKYRLKGEWFSTNVSLIEYISEWGGE